MDRRTKVGIVYSLCYGQSKRLSPIELRTKSVPPTEKYALGVQKKIIGFYRRTIVEVEAERPKQIFFGFMIGRSN